MGRRSRARSSTYPRRGCAAPERWMYRWAAKNKPTGTSMASGRLHGRGVPGLSASRGAGWSVTRTSARNGILWDVFPYYRPIYLISDTCLMGPRMCTAAARQSGRGANAAMGHERDLLRQP
jgi:hypothetical protein